MEKLLPYDKTAGVRDVLNRLREMYAGSLMGREGIGGFARGVGAQAARGVAEAARHPVNTMKSLGQVAGEFSPGSLARALTEEGNIPHDLLRAFGKTSSDNRAYELGVKLALEEVGLPDPMNMGHPPLLPGTGLSNAALAGAYQAFKPKPVQEDYWG